jgi:hypothetical protein
MSEITSGQDGRNSDNDRLARALRGRAARRKGAKRERQLVKLHLEAGIHCERVPLSGAARYQGNGGDIDLYIRGRDNAPLICESKSRATGAGFTTLGRWLGDHDALFLTRDRADPLVVLPWSTWIELLERVRR